MICVLFNGNCFLNFKNDSIEAIGRKMKKIYTLASLFLCSATISFAQLTGVKSIPGDYASMQLAVNALNTSGVGTGGVTFNIAAGYTETLTGALVITASGTAANPVVFQKSGAGANPKLTSYTGTIATAGATGYDAMLVLAGSDYVTINGFEFVESAANTTATTQMEFGVLLAKQSATNGAQHNAIINNTITLNYLNTGSKGISIVDCNSSSFTALNSTSPAGGNSFNKIYGNIITKVNDGIWLRSGSAPSTVAFIAADTANDIGGTVAASGNTIKNFGGTATAANGVYLNNQRGINVSNNRIVNNDGTHLDHPNVLTGINLSASSLGAGATVLRDTISLRASGVSFAIYGISNSFGSTPNGNTNIEMGYNDVVINNPNATSGATAGIYSLSGADIVNVHDNNIHDFVYGSTGSASGSQVDGINIATGSALPVKALVVNNTINNLVRHGTGITEAIGVLAGDSATISGNIINNILLVSGSNGNGATYGIRHSGGSKVDISNNSITNILNQKTTASVLVAGINASSTAAKYRLFGNSLKNIVNWGQTSTLARAYGMNLGNSNTGFNFEVYGNTIDSVSADRGNDVAGIALATCVPVIFKNKIYNISSNSSDTVTVVAGINIASVSSGYNSRIYNNLIADIKAKSANSAVTAPSVRGVFMGNSQTNSAVFMDYNTIYLNGTSTGANFSSAGIFQAGFTVTTTNALTLRNNIIINNCTPTGTGRAVAFQRSNNNLQNYNTGSNNNIFYAGAPDASHLIYADGTNANQSVVAYKATVVPMDNNAQTENTSFLSVVGTSADFLKVNPAVATFSESGGLPLTTVPADFGDNVRNAVTPDIGAWEFAGIANDVLPPVIVYTPLPTQSCTAAPILSVAIGDASGVNVTDHKPRLYFKKSGEANVWLGNTAADNGWKFVEPNNTSSPFIFPVDYSLLNSVVANGDSIQYFVIAQDVNGLVSSNQAVYTTAPTSTAIAAAAFPVSAVNSYQINNNVSLAVMGSNLTPCTNAYDTLFASVTMGGNATIGTNATVSVTTYSPYYGTATTGKRVQMLYEASTLQAAGLRAGPITSLSLFVDAAITAVNIPDLVIKMAATNASALATGVFSNEAYTTVKDYSIGGVGYMPIAGENLHLFDQAFNWDGISNIVVEMCHAPIASTSSVKVYYVVNLGSNVHTKFLNDGCSSSATTATTAAAVVVTKFGGKVDAGTSNYSYAWSNGSGVVGSNNDTIIVQPTFASGNTITYTATATNPSGCSVNNSVTVTQNTTYASLAGNSCSGYDVALNNSFSSQTCGLIAKVVPSGAAPAAGNINACVVLDNSVQQAPSGVPYLQRHYNIEPAANVATATGTITLYYLQSEFDAFNTYNTNYSLGMPALPINSIDAAGIANVRIAQFHGTGTAPGSYSGSEVTIDPVDANIVWDAANQRWAVTFDVTGFSGFYLTSSSAALSATPLFITFLEFGGRVTGISNTLAWATASEENMDKFAVERSADAKQYESVGSVASKASGGNSQSVLKYTLEDKSPLTGVGFYRIAATSKDGSIRYSNVVALQRGNGPLVINNLRPNPTNGSVKFNVVGASDNVMITVRDITGKMLFHTTVAATSEVTVDLAKYTNGIYLVEAMDAQSGAKTVFKVSKN